ncbi:MAG: oligosaccharide flippase family protein, partial [Albidovulum sp.]
MSVSRQFSHGVAWMAIGNWVEQAVNFAVFVTLARLLGAKDYGLLAMAMVFIVLCESLVRESLSEYLISAHDPAPEDFNATFWLLAGLGVMLAVVLALVSGIAARAYGEPEVQRLILALSPSVIIVALNAVPVAILRRALSFRILSLRAIAGVVLGGVVGIGMALNGYGVWSFVGQWLTLISTNAVMAWTAVDWRPGFKTSRAHLGRAASFGGKVLGLRAGELAATQTPLLVIGATLGPVATGLFSVSWRLVETLSFLIVTPLRQASQSAFAALQRQGGGAGLLLVDIARLTGLVAMPFFAGLAVLAGPIITLVFGEEWLRAAPVLSVMAAMGAYLCISRVQISFCLAAGRAGAISVLAWLIVGLAALFIWIASGWGIEAVAAAVVVAHVLLWPFYLVIVARIAGMPVWPFISCHILPLIGAV